MTPGLGLRTGDLVEVRSAEEILATLDPDGRLAGLPFMPEMLRFCGQRFRVFARAHKPCDTIRRTGCRSLPDAVYLANLRCDGAAHGACQAGCLLYWKEAWLKRVGGGDRARLPAAPAAGGSGCTIASLHAATRRADDSGAFVCQATELLRATSPLSPRDPRPYLRDLYYGNVGLLRFCRVVALAGLNAFQRWRGGRTIPDVAGRREKTPQVRLNLQVGERVRVKSRDAIVTTLDRQNRNRGLLFDKEMLPYCGGTFRVAARVERIINERTGGMLHFDNDCIVLEGVICQAIYSERRLFCRRAITPYWREAWLERIPG